MIQPLVDNAVRYGRSVVDVSLERNGAFALIDVVDDGPGVAGAEEATIFDPGTRGAAAAGRADGAGLGLALARRLARSAGGEITVTPGSPGGRFTLKLPLARRSDVGLRSRASVSRALYKCADKPRDGLRGPLGGTQREASMTSEPPAASGARITEDEQMLHKLGYAQELFRAMGGFQNFAISFTIISILAGCLTSYYIAFESGGPIAVTWGWLLIGVFSTIIALAMAEIASSFPTAGGLYYWASKLGSPGWGWATGWFNLIGQIAVTAAIGYGLATFATVLFDDLFSWEVHLNNWFGFDYNETVFFAYALFLLAACLINVFDVRITSLLNTVSAYWHMAGVAVIVLVLIVVPDHHQSAGYVFGRRSTRPATATT